ncbi:MAG: DUF4190 domain-containing protein [Verrucomicrobia bacterium]|nr:DUF4190 domain-containing protein [Verrucomicrobiota bacterium]
MNPPSLPPHTAAPTKSNLAVWSLVLGILSLVCFSILAGIPAIICGFMARSRIRASGGTLTGDGLALAGLILGFLSIVWLGVLSVIAIPNFVKARDTAIHNACVNNLRQIDGAKEMWALENKKAAGAPVTAADLSQYLKGGFESLHCLGGGTYTVNSLDQRPTCSVPGHALP